MKEDAFDRRAFLKSAVAGGAAAAAGTLPKSAEAQGTAPTKTPAQESPPPTYSFLNPDEAAFIEALVDHMVPADQYSPKGTDLGLNLYIDRALASGWGKGDRTYMQGPWRPGVPSQGYQLPLTPAALYRSGIAAANAACAKTYGRRFDKLDPAQREEFMQGMRSGKVVFEGGPPSRAFFATVYQNVMEGMFGDPMYGGNRGKAGWKMIGFPGVIAVHYQNVEKFRGKKYSVEPVSISDMS